MSRNLIVYSLIILSVHIINSIEIHVSQVKNLNTDYFENNKTCAIKCFEDGAWVERVQHTDKYLNVKGGLLFLSVETCKSFDNADEAVGTSCGLKIISTIKKNTQSLDANLPCNLSNAGDIIKPLLKSYLYLSENCNEQVEFDLCECFWSEVDKEVFNDNDELVMCCYWPESLNYALNLSSFDFQKFNLNFLDPVKPEQVQSKNQYEKLEFSFTNNTVIYSELFYMHPYQSWVTECSEKPSIDLLTFQNEHINHQNRVLLNQGAFRTLQTQFSFSEDAVGRFINIVDVLPKEMYANQEQIENMEKYGGPKVIFFSKFNLELMVACGKQHLLWTIQKIRSSNEVVNVPLSVYYLNPSYTSKYAEFTVSAPVACWISDGIGEKNVSSLLLTTHSQVDWSRFGNIKAYFPIGNLNEKNFINLVTKLIATASFLILTTAIACSPG